MKRRNWKKISIISGIIALVFLLMIIFIPRLININRYSHLIVAQVERAAGGEVTLGPISWGISCSAIAKVVVNPSLMSIMKVAAITRPSMKLCMKSPNKFMYAKVWTLQCSLWQCLQ